MRRIDIPWFGIVMMALILAFAGFIGFTIYDEIRDDRTFREDCEAKNGIVLTESRDSLRICVTIDDAQRKVIIDIDR